jgi:hypothetical protein
MMGAMHDTALTLMFVELLGGAAGVGVADGADDVPVVWLPLWTRTGRNRAVASARENFIVAERDRFLHSQRKTGQEGSWTYMCEH